ncbi:hypothetical protein BLNAU_24633 [Blattamonas nauphoetae]|uniref:Uncharacterized protein n=1 Tax=Blattamonas nauphoetae TaxID=2049346 RepID=A0ABQ9WLW2_9EUKA|nr:hypothetical protein BLNAU_24633 [Blattamonas nauphoetae]
MAGCWTSRTNAPRLNVVERRTKCVKKEESEGEGAKSLKCTAPLPHISACFGHGRRSSVELFIALTADTATDDTLSLRQPAPPILERRTRQMLDDLRGSSTGEDGAVHIDRRTEHRHSRYCRITHLLPQWTRFCSDTHHIVAFAHSKCRCCLVTAETAGETGVQVE